MLELVQNIDMNLVYLGIGLIVLMLCNILMGSIDALLTQEFNKKKFLQGVIKAVVVVICFILTYFVGLLNPNVVAISVNGEMVNVLTAMNLVVLAGFTWYAKEVFIKLATFIKGKIDIGEGM